ncbi:hypothetical protein [Streptomyces sp. NPDC057253]|uniref:tetratricopeptide repeat protein n=1 Tax=Streptomyces sp. NPDC057253 TaxID=3346069 RepID=UPI00362AB23E
MSRLSRDKKRDQQWGATPIDVRVPLTGECATVAGTPVSAPPGEELHQAVLTHLHHLALTSGHPVHATVHDARIGYVVPLEVTTDGTSRFTADPVRMPPPPEPPHDPAKAFEAPSGPILLAPTPGGAPGARPPVDEPAQEAAPTFRMRKLSAPEPTDTEPSPTHVLRQLPDTQPPGPATSPDHTSAPTWPPAPGTAVPPTGAFGPPPVMDARPAPAAEPLAPTHSAYTPSPLPPTPLASPPTDTPSTPLPSTDFPTPPQPLPSAGSAPTPTPRPAPLLTPVPLLDDPDPQPAPVRGFDAVAEAVMGDGLVVGDTGVLGEGVERISEAVREGRTEVAAELAQEVVGEASRSLGAEHPDVLRVRELAAYIAYLGGEPVQAAEISLDLARIQHRAGDAESAYGNMQSAATAWKAVRDPSRGLALGSDLLALWTELAAGEGPAADEPEKLESARSRMLRLAERARNANS